MIFIKSAFERVRVQSTYGNAPFTSGEIRNPTFLSTPSTGTAKFSAAPSIRFSRPRRHASAKNSTVFRGAIFAGPRDDEFVLQPDPSSRTEWAIIRVEDLVERAAIEKVSKETLGLTEGDPDIFLVKVKSGSVVRTVREDQRVVEVPPLAPGCSCPSDSSNVPTVPNAGGCSCSQQPSTLGGDGIKMGAAVAAGIPCKETVGACGPGFPGLSGYPCASPGAFCRVFGLFPRSGTCTTVAGLNFQLCLRLREGGPTANPTGPATGLVDERVGVKGDAGGVGCSAPLTPCRVVCRRGGCSRRSLSRS